MNREFGSRRKGEGEMNREFGSRRKEEGDVNRDLGSRRKAEGDMNRDLGSRRKAEGDMNRDMGSRIKGEGDMMKRKKEKAKAIYEGWMVRYGRRKIGKSYLHMRYFVLEPRLLAYYKRKPQDNMVPLKTLVIDANCRVEDRGLKTHHGHMVYVLCVYNKKDKYHQLTMAAFNIQEALMWKEKIELVIDQQHDSLSASGNKALASCESGVDSGKNAFSSDQESVNSLEDEDEGNRGLARRMTRGNGPSDSIVDWIHEPDLGHSNQNIIQQVFSRKHWRLIRCQNGLRIFEELLEVDYLPRSFSRAMKAVGVVDATCEAIFELVMSMDGTRFEWDCTFQYGSLVEEVDGHTAILYHRLQLDWFPMFVWPRDLCYVRYWRRNDDGSYVVLLQSREHANCDRQPGFVRAQIESGGFKISPLKSRNGRSRSQVQHLMQIDLKGWGVGYIPSFQQHCLLRMLSSVAGLREFFSQTDQIHTVPRIPVMVNMTRSSSSKKDQKSQEINVHPGPSLDPILAGSRQSILLDEDSDDDDDYQIPEAIPEAYAIKTENDVKQIVLDEEPLDQIDLSCFSGNLCRDDHDNSRDCWSIPDGKNIKVRSKNFLQDKSKIPAGKHLMELAAVDWLKDTKRMDNVARRVGCVAQVASEKGLFSLIINLQIPGSTNYSMVFYFVMKQLVPESLLQRFVDGDDEFRNSRFKLIPSVPKGSWIVRQSIGSSPCLLGKAVDCTYIRRPKYLEIDVDIGSSTVANGVLGLVLGVVTSLVVDMAFLIQANTSEELPEQLIGAVRVSHLELSSAMISGLDNSPDDSIH
ncbi:protein ENHANCED DISEASE RESISTANCE 2 isoform X2 [Elaeis guineensis]|uniref:Protein ENHANCED DISEASE RESISTANCE 2 isoform X1 n=1 Tax=Elaeis guineensis var. tenera TaxID=51953 RepID=A0A6I9SCF9_ELAGV|nr:protein ENHANCED DISEASE RESISTANCE 2 isoform X1 [Elaeis guineensis]